MKTSSEYKKDSTSCQPRQITGRSPSAQLWGVGYAPGFAQRAASRAARGRGIFYS
jgi:hypothetical protein